MSELIKFVESESAPRRAEHPEFGAGDTVNVYVSRYSKVWLFSARIQVLERPLPFVRFQMELGLSVSSQSCLQMLTRSRLPVVVKYAVLVYTT